MSQEKDNNTADDCLYVPKEKQRPIDWFGSWDQLNSVFDWCIENGFLKYDFSKNKELWLQANFHDIKERPKIIKNTFDGKMSWYGKLETIIEFFLKLKEVKLIDEYKISEWIADHFLYYFRDGLRVINSNSLKSMWSNLSNSTGRTALSPEQKKSLNKILKK